MMKMKMKMTLMASALAFAVAGQANAAIVDMANATGSNLVLSIWDTTSLTSYTKDLGINMSSFVSGVSGTASALTANSASVGNLSFAADTLLGSYLAGVTQATTVWNVTAGDNIGTGFRGQQYLSTTNATAATVKGQANSQLTQFGGANGAGGYYTQTSGAMGATNTSVTSSSATPNTYAGGTGFGTNWSAKSVFNSTAAIGSTLGFWYLTPSSTSNIAKASVAQFNGGAANAAWTLGANGNLSFTSGAPVAAVPEPGEWALMLSGFGLIGFIAMRRKNQNTSMTFA